ncbi:MAG: hypothetical protein KOO62_00005 [candidate division Zixibacteria bacterium]|nr:hypothetical protein [candidate division Zixibacteria bacterium]
MYKSGIIALLMCLVLASPSFGQLCGNANDDTTVNILDWIYQFEYLRGNAMDPPINLENADCDGITGVTIGDAAWFSNFYFGGGPPLNCDDTGSYPYPQSWEDTVFMPRMLGIPEGVTTVIMPVVTVFMEDVEGVYLPFIHYGAGSNSVFEWGGATYSTDFSVLMADDLTPDTSLLMGIDLNGTTHFPGRHEYFNLTYYRDGFGTGDIVPQFVNRPGLWQIAIVKGGRLFRPVVEYYDTQLPDTLFASPTSKVVEAPLGQIPAGTFTVHFSSSGDPINFDLTPTESFIVIDSPFTVGFTTPTDIVFVVYADTLPAGTYQGYVDIVDVTPGTVLDADQIAITLVLTEGVTYPPGDLNCDGEVNITDITVLVAYMFLGGAPLQDCQ